jgi:hypothetical protein
MSRVIILHVARDNQSQYEHQEMTPRFIPRSTCLPASYVLVVSIVHLVVRKLIGTTPSPHQGATENLPKVRVTQ